MAYNRRRVVTFYSYKGGVGRSMLLANVAYILAYCGKRVLVVDWDLEAPGLEHYFAGVLPASRPIGVQEGVIDLLDSYRDFAEAAMAEVGVGDAAALFDDETNRRAGEFCRDRELAASLTDYLVQLELPDDFTRNGGCIDFVPAGQRQAWDQPSGQVTGRRGDNSLGYGAYVDLVTTFDWDTFYRRLAGAEFLGVMATRMLEDYKYDYVLVDSRTGLSESAAVSTISLADDLVVCFVASNQALDGALDTARKFEYRDPKYRGGRPLDAKSRLLPVPMRVDRDQRSRYGAARQMYRTAFADILGKYVDNQGKYWSDVEVPYVGNYAFEELAGPTAELDPKDDAYQQAAKRIALQIADFGLHPGRLKAWEETEALVWRGYADRVRRSLVKQFGGVVISYARKELDWALWLKSVAEDSGIAVELHAAWNERLSELRERVPKDEAWCLVPLLSENYLDTGRSRDATAFWKWAKSPVPDCDIRLHPIRLGEFEPSGTFADAFGVQLDDHDEELARDTFLEMLAAVRAHPAGDGGAPRASRPGRYPGAGGNQPDDVRLGQRLRRARSRADLDAVMSHSLSLGRHFTRQERFREARALLEEAAALAERLDNRERAAAAWLELGLLDLDRLQPDAAIAAFDKAIGYLDDRHGRFAESISFGKAKALRMRAEEQRDDETARKDRLKAADLLDSILHSADDPDVNVYAAALIERGGLHLLDDQNRIDGEKSQLWQARKEYAKACRRFKKLGDQIGEIRAELGMGDVALTSDVPVVALQHFGRALLLLAALEAKPWQLAYRAQVCTATAYARMSGPAVDRSLQCAVNHFDEALAALERPVTRSSAEDETEDVASGGAGRPGRRAARTRDPRRWADAAVELANVLDRLDAPSRMPTGYPGEATVLRLDAIRVLNWGGVNPKLEYANAIRAARSFEGKLPSGYGGRKEHLKNAVRACWILRETGDHDGARVEWEWIRDNWEDGPADVWPLRDMAAFTRNMLPREEAENLIRYLASAFGTGEGD